MTKKSLTELRIPCRCGGAFRYLAPTRQTQPTDITHRNRRSHSAMHPMEALHSRSGTTSRPCSIGLTETLQASLRFRVPWPPAPSARRTSVCSLNMDCYSHSDGPREPSGGHRASPWGVRRRLGGPRGTASVGRLRAVVGLKPPTRAPGRGRAAEPPHTRRTR